MLLYLNSTFYYWCIAKLRGFYSGCVWMGSGCVVSSALGGETLFTFFCGKKSNKKSRPKSIYSPISGVAMFNFCTLVASALGMLLFMLCYFGWWDSGW